MNIKNLKNAYIMSKDGVDFATVIMPGCEIRPFIIDPPKRQAYNDKPFQKTLDWEGVPFAAWIKKMGGPTHMADRIRDAERERSKYENRRPANIAKQTIYQWIKRGVPDKWIPTLIHMGCPKELVPSATAIRKARIEAENKANEQSAHLKLRGEL